MYDTEIDPETVELAKKELGLDSDEDLFEFFNQAKDDHDSEKKARAERTKRQKARTGELEDEMVKEALDKDEPVLTMGRIGRGMDYGDASATAYQC
mmetsp:Transcript_2250/g.4299  ORF Transcript_2250/g.4299 Transcript_2250/m.4299 type:complete len:96 (+) Transcript_2250:192-479(+)